jgi:hypothetical protein
MSSRKYIDNVQNFYVEVYRKAVKSGKVGLKDFLALNKRWDRAYNKLKKEVKK